VLVTLLCPGVDSARFCSVPEALVTEVADHSVTGQAFATSLPVVFFTTQNALFFFFLKKKRRKPKIDKQITPHSKS